MSIQHRPARPNRRTAYDSKSQGGEFRERKDALVFMGSEIVGIVEMEMGIEIVVSMRNDFPRLNERSTYFPNSKK